MPRNGSRLSRLRSWESRWSEPKRVVTRITCNPARRLMSLVGQKQTPNDVCDGGSFPPKRSPRLQCLARRDSGSGLAQSPRGWRAVGPRWRRADGQGIGADRIPAANPGSLLAGAGRARGLDTRRAPGDATLGAALARGDRSDPSAVIVLVTGDNDERLSP
jgi:hypothetical protein